MDQLVLHVQMQLKIVLLVNLIKVILVLLVHHVLVDIYSIKQVIHVINVKLDVKLVLLQMERLKENIFTLVHNVQMVIIRIIMEIVKVVHMIVKHVIQNM